MRALILLTCAALAGCDTPEGDGVAEGDPFPALAWEGHVNDSADGLATGQPFVDYSSSQLAAGGRRWALVHTSEAF